MEVHDPSPAPVPEGARAYERAEVLRYLDDADEARERLEAELEEARLRCRAAEQVTPARVTTALAGELCDLTGRLDDDRRATWATVQQIVADGMAQAAAIVADAQDEARRIRADRTAGVEPPLVGAADPRGASR